MTTRTGPDSRLRYFAFNRKYLTCLRIANALICSLLISGLLILNIVQRWENIVSTNKFIDKPWDNAEQRYISMTMRRIYWQEKLRVQNRFKELNCYKNLYILRMQVLWCKRMKLTYSIYAFKPSTTKNTNFCCRKIWIQNKKQFKVGIQIVCKNNLWKMCQK